MAACATTFMRQFTWAYTLRCIKALKDKRIAEHDMKHAWTRTESTMKGDAQANSMVYSVADAVTGHQRNNTTYKIDVFDKDLAKDLCTEYRER